MDFKNVYSKGKRLYSKNFYMIFLKSDNSDFRVGISILKRVGIAVARNRIKRVVRSICRDNSLNSLDLIFVFRSPEAKKMKHSELLSEYKRLVKRIK